MALVQIQQFNWMGYEGTESESLNVALLRNVDMGSMRLSDYNQRQEVVADIRMRLKIIKGELGLLPPEETADGAVKEDVEEDVFVEENVDDDEVKYAERLAERLAERRRRVQATRGALVDSGDEDDVYYYPGPPAESAKRESLAAFALGLRSLLCSTGETFVSYLDGAEFVALSQLVEHNESRRGGVEAANVALPSADEFAVTSLRTALEKREQLRMKLDAVRAANDSTYAARIIRSAELDNSGRPVTNVTPADGTEAELSAKLVAAKSQLESARLAHNKRARIASRRIQQALANKANEYKELEHKE